MTRVKYHFIKFDFINIVYSPNGDGIISATEVTELLNVNYVISRSQLV